MNYINLGLSVDWADSNFDAQNPQEYGNYYSFQEASKLKFPDGIRLPSYEEFQELINECHWSMIPDLDRECMLSGCVVTGKNGNKIFLPAAGCDEMTVGYGADFWSGEELDFNEAHSLHFRFGEVFTEAQYMDSKLTLRTVKEK